MKKIIVVPFMLMLMLAQAFAGSVGDTSHKAITLRIAHSSPDKTPTYPKHGHAVAFKQRVETNTNGLVRVDIFPLGQLYGDAGAIVAVSNGTIFAAEVDTSPLSAWERGFGIFSLPGLFMERGHLHRFIRSDKGGRELEKRAEAKGLLVSWWVAAPVVLFTTDKPVIRLEDMPGLKIRTPPTKLMVKAMEALGASAIPIPVNELYIAAQTGMVNGVATQELSIAMRRLDEVFRHCLENTIYFNLGASVCSVAQLNEMCPDIRKTVVEAWREAGRIHEEQMQDEWLAKSHLQLEERGMNFLSLGPAQWEEFQKAWSSLVEEQVPEIGMGLYGEAIRTRHKN